MLDVLMLLEVVVMMMKAVMKVAAIMLLVLLEVLVKEFVVEALLLFSLSSIPNPRTTPSTRPAGRCLGFWG
jgi:hypothetical protein